MQIMKAYRNMMARVGGVLLLAGAGLFVSTVQAEAALIAYICDDAACGGGGDLVVTDELGGDLAPGAVGSVTSVGRVAGYEVSVNIAVSKPVVGSASSPAMNLTYSAQNVVGGGGATIYFYASDTDFIGITPLQMVFNAAAGTTATAEVYGGSSNANLDLGTVLASSGPVVPPTGDIFLATPVVGLGANPYSLTVGVSTSAPDVASGDLKLVPEPATIALFGIGLFGVGVMARRRRQAQAQVQ
jgi:hypothetical protein